MAHLDHRSSGGLRRDARGGELRVRSETATAMSLCLFEPDDLAHPAHIVEMTRDGVFFTAFSPLLTEGRAYGVTVEGTGVGPDTVLMDPFARGLTHTHNGLWRSVVVDEDFDWGTSQRPLTPLRDTVIYEAHVRGISMLNPSVPEELRGSYAGLAHESTIAHLTGLGVSAVELLPVQAFASEQRLIEQGQSNYWGYNTLGFFAPHPAYASAAARAQGASAVLREFKGMVKILHEAGLSVYLDVVYNHTAEEGRGGPDLHLRGIDEAAYYRLGDDGYLDTTGCGNTLNTATDAGRTLVLDSLRYWAGDVQIDGFRFDLATSLGRDAQGDFTPEHPLFAAIGADPVLAESTIIAEPWDVGDGGWRTGGFPDGFGEWNDRFRDTVRSFWLSDIKDARRNGSAAHGIADLATVLAGSADLFPPRRGPLASVNFVTAHDGFTLADLTAYDVKHNLGNGEGNRDGTDDNRSFNHGVEGSSADQEVLATRRKATRNLMASLLFAAGVPMLTAGDEIGRTQRGNNNAYCQDNDLNWMHWSLGAEQQDLLATATRLIDLRRRHPALRPSRFARSDRRVRGARTLVWFDAGAGCMDVDDWNSPQKRTVQCLLTAQTDDEQTSHADRLLLVVHGVERPEQITLPSSPGSDAATSEPGIAGFELLWDSADDLSRPEEGMLTPPGAVRWVSGTSLQLYRVVDADGATSAVPVASGAPRAFGQ